MILTTDAFSQGGSIDPRYTCDLDNSSPELRWNQIPSGLVEFALIMDDPDAPMGLYTHWLVYAIPPHIRHLPAGIPPQEGLPNGILQGLNTSGKLGYLGPCPPVGDPPHRYYFRLYALREPIQLPSRASREDVLRAMENKIIATAEVMGRYQRAVRKAG